MSCRPGWVLLPLRELGETGRGLVLGVEVKHHGFTFGHVEVEPSLDISRLRGPVE